MRFEIGSGGMVLVLAGLAGLSAAVFGLGLVAGHELAGPEPGSQPVVAAYPMPPANNSSPQAQAEAATPPPAAPGTGEENPPSEADTAATGDAISASNPPAPPPAAPAVASNPPAPAKRIAARKPLNPAVASRNPQPAVESDEEASTGAAVAPPSTANSEGDQSADTGSDEGQEEAAPPPRPKPAPRRLAALNPPAAPHEPNGPYSVQIDAMMDLAGAQQMAQKIRAKGFSPYIVRTEVNGKVWYRLRVGHYTSPEQAQAAESKLHQEFNDQ
jgi:cell division septation protein DedD